MKKLDVQDVGELRKIVGTDTLSVEEVLADFNAVTETGFVSMGDFMEIIFGYIINAHGYERLQDKNTQEIVEHLFNLFDEDGNGVVDYQELASGLATLCGSSTSAEKVRAIFNVYDKNGDGYISMQEMTEYLTATFKVMLQTKPMAKVGPRQLAAMIAHEAFQQCDANKDGKLNFAEFTMWFDENGGDAVSSLNENGASPAGPRHDFEAMAQKIVFQREYTEKAEKNELASRRAKLETARRKRVELAEKLERMHAGAKSIHEVDFELHKSHMKGDGTLPNVDTSMPTPSPASFAQSNSNKEKRYGKVEQTVRRVYVSPGKPQRSFRHMTDMENEFGKVIDKLNSVDEDLHATSEVLHERNIKIDAINSELRTLKAYHATLLTIMRDLAGKVGGKNKRIVRRFSTISTAEMMSTSTEIPDPKNFEDESFARQYIDKKIDILGDLLPRFSAEYSDDVSDVGRTVVLEGEATFETPAYKPKKQKQKKAQKLSQQTSSSSTTRATRRSSGTALSNASPPAHSPLRVSISKIQEADPPPEPGNESSMKARMEQWRAKKGIRSRGLTTIMHAGGGEKTKSFLSTRK